jgi:hypothetical protein
MLRPTVLPVPGKKPQASAIEMGLGKIRLQFQCLDVARFGPGPLALTSQGTAKVVMCFRIIRPQFQCSVVAGDCLWKRAKPAVRLAEVIVKFGHGAFQSDGLSNVLGGNLVLTHLAGADPKEVQGIDMIGLDCKNLPVNPLGRMQTPCLVVLYGNR